MLESITLHWTCYLVIFLNEHLARRSVQHGWQHAPRTAMSIRLHGQSGLESTGFSLDTRNYRTVCGSFASMPEIYGQVNDISQIWNMNESQVRLVPLLRKAWCMSEVDQRVKCAAQSHMRMASLRLWGVLAVMGATPHVQLLMKGLTQT